MPKSTLSPLLSILPDTKLELRLKLKSPFLTLRALFGRAFVVIVINGSGGRWWKLSRVKRRGTDSHDGPESQTTARIVLVLYLCAFTSCLCANSDAAEAFIINLEANMMI